MLFKGIALFTPGGDLIYSLDPTKQKHWHLDLCLQLQNILGLSEPPHFLVPGYTATLDRWQDSHTGEINTLAEIYPSIQRYRLLLNTIFGIEDLVWQISPWMDESSSNPMILDTYRNQFPQLWENHDLIIPFQDIQNQSCKPNISEGFQKLFPLTKQKNLNYLLRLFVSGKNTTTESTLERIHQILEEGLDHPYTLKIIDISKHPELAEKDRISATPTLIRVFPEPVRRIVGEFKDIEGVLNILTTI